MTVRLTDLPWEVLHIVLDDLKLQQVSYLLSFRNNHLITSIRSHRVWGKFLVDVKTHRDAAHLADAFALMRAVSGSLRKGGRASLAKSYDECYYIRHGLSRRDVEFRQWPPNKRKHPLASYARYSARELSWDRHLFDTETLLTAGVARALDIVAFSPSEPLDFWRCRAMDNRSTIMGKFLDAIGDESTTYATFSTSAAKLSRTLSQLVPKAGKLVAFALRSNLASRTPNMNVRPPWLIADLTALVAAKLHEHTLYDLIAVTLGKYDFFPRESKPMIVEPDDSMIVTFSKPAIAELLARFLLRLCFQKEVFKGVEGSLHAFFSQLSIDNLRNMSSIFAKWSKYRGYFGDEWNSSHLTHSDRHVFINHAEFWTESLRGVWKVHKRDRLTALARIYADHPTLLKIASDPSHHPRANCNHIAQNIQNRAKKLAIWSPFTRLPFKRDTFKHSFVRLVPLNKHLDFILRQILKHPIVADDHTANRIAWSTKEIAQLLQRPCFITNSTFEASHSELYSQKSASRRSDLVDGERAPHQYPVHVVDSIIKVFGHSPKIGKTTSGAFRFEPRVDADFYARYIHANSEEHYRRSEEDVQWIKRFLSVLTYLKNQFAAAWEIETLFDRIVAPDDEVLKARDARKIERRRKQALKNLKPPRFQHPTGTFRGRRNGLEWRLESFRRWQIYEQARQAEADLLEESEEGESS